MQIGPEMITLQVWDTAGQERFRALSPIYYRGAHAAVAVFAVTDRDSLESLPEQISLFSEVAKDALVFVAGNKMDCQDKQVISKSDAEEFARERGWQLFFTSAKTGDGLGELFTEVCTQLSKVKLDLKATSRPVRRESDESCC
jgi:small GTP-binding protein